MRQIGVATLAHEAAITNLPTAGWGWKWIGDPDKGAGRKQPGSWAYQLLPYLEGHAIHNLGLGSVDEQKRAAGKDMAEKPLEVFYCSSRRAADSFPTNLATNLQWFNADVPERMARLDYAANVGDVYVVWEAGPTPDEVESGKAEFFNFHAAERRGIRYSLADVTGVIVQREPIALSAIVDGLSNTYLIGEKRLVRGRYGLTDNDDQSAWSGDDLDTTCGVQWPPSADPTPKASIGEQRRWTFGSAHPQGTHMLICDGSVQFVDYSIDLEVHIERGNRNDAGKNRTASGGM